MDEKTKEKKIKHLKKHQWKPGQSGNPAGRKPGTRPKLTERFFNDFLTVWEEGGIEAMRKVREDDPSAFLKVAAGLMPKDININDTRDIAFDRFIEDLDDGQLNQLIAGLCAIGSTGASGEGKDEEGAATQSDKIH